MLKMIERHPVFLIVIEYVVKINRSKSHLKDNASPKPKSLVLLSINHDLFTQFI